MSRHERFGTTADEQKVVKKILELKGENFTIRMIAGWLNDHKVPTKRGGRWHASTIANVLKDNDASVPATLPRNMEQKRKEQLEKDGGFVWDSLVFDKKTGEPKLESAWIDAAQYEQIEEQVEKIRQMTLAEKTERFSFWDVATFALGDAVGMPCGADAAAIVKELTKRTGRDVHALVDDITDQPQLKRDLREAVKFLLAEIAIQRHINLNLRGRR